MTVHGPAIVIGMGGIGSAMADLLDEEGIRPVIRIARRNAAIPIDLLDVPTIAAAAAAASSALAGRAPGLVFVATGLLHDLANGPEKATAALDPVWMARNFAINAIGPALIARHFLPLFDRERPAVFAALSARVGSIADNRLGGWHSYRASKAALNQYIRTIAIELARTHKRAICVGLHPGTVDTRLSQPFQANVAAGHLFAPDRAAAQLLDVIDGLKPADSGKCLAWDGAEIAP